jgi:hypothetical protein
VREKRRRAILLFVPLIHDVHRIVQHYIRKLPGSLGGKDHGFGVFPQEHGKGSDVVLMRVTEKNRVDMDAFKRGQQGESLGAVLLWVGTAIQHNFTFSEGEKVGVGPDFEVLSEVGKLKGCHDEKTKE